MECRKLREGENLPSIDIDDVQNNTLSNSLVKCIGHIYQKLDKDIDALEKLNNSEKYIQNLYMMHNAIIDCLKSIDYAIAFISSYNYDYYKTEHAIPYDKFCEYHYDVVCHKVATVKDLYFKFINLTYRLDLPKCNWNNINDKAPQINNNDLFDVLEINKSLMGKVESSRNASSHEGKTSWSVLNNLSLYLMNCKICSPDSSEYYLYNKKSPKYEYEINKAKKIAVGEIQVIRYNSFAITKEFFFCLSHKFENLIVELGLDYSNSPA